MDNVAQRPRTVDRQLPNTVFVGGLREHHTDEELFSYFAPFGRVMKIARIPDKNFLFVHFRFPEEARRAAASFEKGRDSLTGLKVDLGAKHYTYTPEELALPWDQGNALLYRDCLRNSGIHSHRPLPGALETSHHNGTKVEGPVAVHHETHGERRKRSRSRDPREERERRRDRYFKRRDDPTDSNDDWSDGPVEVVTINTGATNSRGGGGGLRDDDWSWITASVGREGTAAMQDTPWSDVSDSRPFRIVENCGWDLVQSWSGDGVRGLRHTMPPWRWCRVAEDNFEHFMYPLWKDPAIIGGVVGGAAVVIPSVGTLLAELMEGRSSEAAGGNAVSGSCKDAEIDTPGEVSKK